MKKTTILFLLITLFLNGRAQEGQHIVKQGYTVDFFKNNILEPVEWIPYPLLKMSESWKSLLPPEKYSAIIERSESFIGYEWPLTRASVFLDFEETGNRTNFEQIFFSRRNALTALVLGELIENKDRFTEDILDGIWTICEETFWGVPAHLYLQEKGFGLPDVLDPAVDLFAAETASTLAWISYLLGDKLDEISPIIRERIAIEINRRIIEVIESDPQYRWMGNVPDLTDPTLSYAQKSFLKRRPNNWNPWISSNLITCILLLEKDKDRRAKFVAQVLGILDNYIEPYPADGGCDEGTSYWGHAAASTFDCLDLVSAATSKKYNIFNEPKIKNMGEFIARAYVGNGYYLNFSDSSPKPEHSPMLIYRFGKAVKSQPMMEMAAFLALQQNFESVAPSGMSLMRILPELYYSKELLNLNAKESLFRDSWYPDIQLMMSRDYDSSTIGLYLAAKAGHNEESHNHNDVGSFIVFRHGKPAIIDIGSATYDKNYSKSWNRKSEYHNLLPIVNGEVQQRGRKFSASNVSYSKFSNEVFFKQDFSKAYRERAGIKKWERTYNHKKGEYITLSDSYEFEEFKDTVLLPMMFNSLPEISENGEIIINIDDGEVLRINFEKEKFDVELEEINLQDERIKNSWGDSIYRMFFKMRNPAKKGKYSFIIK
jgi:hypothetical protein